MHTSFTDTEDKLLPACPLPTTPSSAKGPYGDHHAPGEDIHERASNDREVPDNGEEEIQDCCDQDGGADSGCIERSCGGCCH
ncbi:hypothetical protein L915_12365 [Phytophthora nicotianae]|uniref:Uncharacterized protein n=1 Tax=Phytophthora nicotianae TaxID=4792 RepID=W2GGT1_PHYNI|nr:hypothetical protein L915_12365 [Phytophthora nicotianae]